MEKIIKRLEEMRGELLRLQSEIDTYRAIDETNMASKAGVRLLHQASHQIDEADTKISHAIAEFNSCG